MKRLLSLTTLLLMAAASFAYTTKINGICYNIYIWSSGAEVTYEKYNSSTGKHESNYTGDVVIPKTITYNGNQYNVTEIGYAAFGDCSDLTSVTIPNSVTRIDSYAFENCSGLTSITIPSSVTTIVDRAFYGCSNLTSVTIPNSVTTIGGNVFYNTAWYENQPDGLVYAGKVAYKYKGTMPANTSIVLEKGTTGISDAAFSYCTELTSITLPASLINLGDNAFEGCSRLSSISLPNKLERIGTYAFAKCSGITSMTIPKTVNKIGYSAFDGCRMNSLTILSDADFVTSFDKRNTFTGLNTTCAILCKGSQVDYIKEYFTSSVIPYDEAYVIDITSYLKGFSLKINKNQYCDQNGTGLKVMFNGVEIAKNDNDEYYVDGLIPNNSYLVEISWNQEGEEKIITKNIKTKQISDVSFRINTGYTTATAKVTSTEDLTCKIVEKGVYVYQPTTAGHKIIAICDTIDSNSDVEISGLIPAKTYRFDAYVKYDDGTVVWYSNYLKQRYGVYDYYKYLPSYDTKGTNPRFISNSISYGVTTFKAEVSYNPDPLHVTSAKFEGYDTDGTSLKLTGLNPNTSYTIKFTVKTQEGSEETAIYTFKTDELTLKTAQPKVVSSGNVIVSAETNVDPEETNVGFEWRRTDWTNDFASQTAPAIVLDGTMEGYIRNMNAEKLWKYRAYYLSNSGTYYYGDWAGIDPSNTSYFEPTVHTYAYVNVEGNTALVKGYALGGTDKVTVQGFKYWKAANVSANIDSDSPHKLFASSITIPTDALTETVDIVGAGQQLMNTTLKGLDYNTTYHYVAFVQTAENEMFYGEEQMFTTGPNTTGIETVDAESNVNQSATVIARYNLSGHRIDNPQPGVNILKMSDGTVRKIFVK